MKLCSNCGTQMNDNAAFCTACGTRAAAPTPAPDAVNVNQPVYQPSPQEYYRPAPAPAYDPYDHTAEFDKKDISDNKVVSMLVYLMGWIGIVIALLAAPQSPYAGFHCRQALKFVVLEVLIGLVAALTFWLLFIPVIAAGIMYGVFSVVKIICFFQICKGKAVEPYVVRAFTFLK